MMHDRVLVLGCSHAEIPLIEQLKKMGYHVTTMGSHIDGLGHSVADQAIHADYSSVQNVHRAIEEFQFAHVVPGANDFGYFTGAQLAPVFGLTGYDPYYCAQSLLLKSNFRDTQSILGLKRPEFIEFDAGALPQLPDEFFPVIVKPLDLSGGKGISVAGSINEFSTACAQAIGLGRTGKAIAEKYLTGSHHACAAIVNKGRIVFSFFDTEYYHKNKFLVAAAASLCSVSDQNRQSVHSDVARIVEAHQLVDGILHAQFINTDDGAYIIELTRRLPGDLYPLLVERACSIPYVVNYLAPFLGRNIELPASLSSVKPVLRQCIFSEKNAYVSGIELNINKRGTTVEKSDFWQVPCTIRNHLIEKLGIVFVMSESASDLAQIADHFHTMVSYSYGEVR